MRKSFLFAGDFEFDKDELILSLELEDDNEFSEKRDSEKSFGICGSCGNYGWLGEKCKNDYCQGFYG